MNTLPLPTEQLLFLIWLAIGKLITIPTITYISGRFPEKKHYPGNISESQRARELRSAYLLLSDPIAFGALFYFHAIRLAENSLTSVLATVIVLILWVELWMYWTHRLMHKHRFLWDIHRHHHLSRNTRPLTSISFSAGEKLICYTLGWALFIAASSWLIPISLYGLFVFYTFYFFASPIAHANSDAFSTLHNLPIGGWWKVIGTSKHHAMHHIKANCNYGFLTTAYDRLLGTFLDELPGNVLKQLQAEELTSRERR